MQPPDLLRTDAAPPNTHALNVPTDANTLMLSWAYSYTRPASLPSSTTLRLAQAAYEVEVSLLNPASGPMPRGTFFSSNRTVSSEPNALVPVALPADAPLCWRVRVWLTNDTSTPSPWSACVFFDTAPAAAAWQATQWIGGRNQLRASFVLPGTAPVTRARLYAAGVGAAYLWLDGARVGDNVMDPPQSVYHSRVLFVAHDVTAALAASGGDSREVRLWLCLWRGGGETQKDNKENGMKKAA